MALGQTVDSYYNENLQCRFKVSHFKNRKIEMKRIIIFFAFACICNCCTNITHEITKTDLKTDDNQLQFVPIFRGRYIPEESIDDDGYFLFDAKLINTTKNRIEFWTLTCTPQINIVLSSNKFQLSIPECSRNDIYLVKLNPNQEFSVPIILKRSVINNKSVDVDYKIKFGFIIYKPKYINGPNKTLDSTKYPVYELRTMKENKENVLWSNEIDLFDSNNYLFEIITKANDSVYIKKSKQSLYKY